MVDKEVIGKIIKASSPKKGERILEIGAGKGQLTEPLSRRSNVIAVEIDKRLYMHLLRNFKSRKNVHLIKGNILKKIDSLQFDKIVSNLPYSICEPLMKKLFRRNFQAFLTIPESFAKKLEQLPYKAFFKTKILFPVPKNAFEPQPNTRSVFVSIVPRDSLLKHVLLQQKSKVKNAIMEALCRRQGATKRQAKEALKPLPTTIKEKRVIDINTSDMKKIESFLDEGNEFKYKIDK